MAQDSNTDDYYPFRWKVADAVEDVLLLHRSKAIGVIALLGLAFILVGFFLLGWGGTTTQTDTASSSTASPTTSEPTDSGSDDVESSTSTTAAPTTTTTSTTTTAVETTTAAPTTTAAVSARAATPEQVASTEAGTIVEMSPAQITIVGGLDDDATADEIVALVTSTFAGVDVDDQLIVDDSFAGASDLTFRLSAADLFGYNSGDLNPTYFPLVDQLAATIVDATDWQVEVSGHTDDSGPADGNQRLSERRAAAAAQRLVDQGVPTAQVTSVGRGEAEPIADNDSESGRTANRRVEFAVTR